jgi:3'-phosphoadenosine 5'-phosphosulfate sulfotransferase (PAPS reductase)/FAD synthetase
MIALPMGYLTANGFWSVPCFICARHYEKQEGNKWGEHWPFSENNNDEFKEMMKRIADEEKEKWDGFLANY